MVKAWIKEHLFEITLFFVIAGIGTPAFFYNDNNLAYQAEYERSFHLCNKVSTQFIKQRCYERVFERYKTYCPEIALLGNVEGCIRDMKARMKALKPKPKFPLKLALFISIIFILGLYLFYLKEKWSSW